MITTKDIYYEMDSSVMLQKFYQLSLPEKKLLIDAELKKYIIFKMESLYGSKKVKEISSTDLTVSELLEILVMNIPKVEHHEILRHFTHYILQIIGNLQNWSVIWWIEEDKKLINCPVLETVDDKLLSLKTHMKTNHIKTFSFVYDQFINNFMISNDKRLVKTK